MGVRDYVAKENDGYYILKDKADARKNITVYFHDITALTEYHIVGLFLYDGVKCRGI